MLKTSEQLQTQETKIWREKTAKTLYPAVPRRDSDKCGSKKLTALWWIERLHC